MWKYTELNAYNSIILHDCKSDSITINGSDLIFDFPDGFWITPNSSHIDHDIPVKTGPAQLCFHEIFEDAPFDAIDIYKTIHLFRKPIFSRRLQPEYTDFLEMFQRGIYELEFISEYYSGVSSLFQCWLWNKNSATNAECQFIISAMSIEYRWNEILHDRKWETPPPNCIITV